MGLTEKLQKKQAAMQEEAQNRVQDFNSLFGVYLQATMAVNLGIVDLRMLPDLKLMKQKFKIPTQGRLGIAEKAFVSELMMNEYGMDESFFKGIDSSAKKNCKKVQDMQSYFSMLQAFFQQLFMALSSEMGMSLRLPGFFRKLIKSSTKDAIHKILTSNDFKAADARRAAVDVRALKEKLGFSEDWMVQYAFPVLMISKGAKVK
mgnify:FL=1